MEEMVKNLSRTVELLAVATHSDTVAQWDEETLHRAFHWALYCEHIFRRFHNNPAIRRVLERQLEMSNQSLDEVFSQYSALTFCDLSRCQHLLLDGLLHNAHVHIGIFKVLFDRYTHLNKSEAGYQDVKGICSSIVETKSACKVLDHLNTTSTISPGTEVQAELLLEKMDAMLKQTSPHCVHQFLDSILQGFEEAGEDFCVIIAAAFQTDSNSQLKCILDWLVLKPSLLEFMCHSLPPSLLTDITKKHVGFRDMYIGVLKKWATEMEYDVNNGEWTRVDRNPSVSFQKLIEHFVSLRDYVETELKALKFADGDFDVRGLSVWGDLLSEINRNCSCHN